MTRSRSRTWVGFERRDSRRYARLLLCRAAKSAPTSPTGVDIQEDQLTIQVRLFQCCRSLRVRSPIAAPAKNQPTAPRCLIGRPGAMLEAAATMASASMPKCR